MRKEIWSLKIARTIKSLSAREALGQMPMTIKELWKWQLWKDSYRMSAVGIKGKGLPLQNLIKNHVKKDVKQKFVEKISSR